MKTYTKEEIYAMSEDEIKRAYDELYMQYSKMFGQEYIGVPAFQSIWDDAEDIAHYIRIEKPAPTPTDEELYEYDY